MAKTNRTPKSKLEMLNDCETHLSFLREALNLYLYGQQKERYKQIAAELRVLVCKSFSNKPILLNLMDEYRFSYDVQPPGPPFDKRPIPLVGTHEDPIEQALNAEFSNALGNEEKLNEALEKQAALRRPVPFREFINRGLAVLACGHEYSYNELIMVIAQQMGSSHEDENVDNRILELRNWVIGGHEGHVAPLIHIAKMVVQVGMSFFNFLVERNIYETRHFMAAD
ncbi:MAG: hypothetical protein ACE5Q6_08305 [Dehalococcoidia bacterium]